MSRKAYHNDLEALEADVLEMAKAVAEAITGSVEALKERNIDKSKAIVANDININNTRYEIEEKCLLLIATQQPMAVDLRTIAAILNIVTDLERIADHAEGTAKISVTIGSNEMVKPLIDIPRMAELSVSMLNRCITAFKERDLETAKAICKEDDAVDDLYEQVYRELLLLMISDPKLIEGATYLIWVAHNLERTADRVTNIAERIGYMVTGKMEEMDSSNY
jgi:phosphate transport system protein